VGAVSLGSLRVSGTGEIAPFSRGAEGEVLAKMWVERDVEDLTAEHAHQRPPDRV
jgi:hypothetical protein